MAVPVADAAVGSAAARMADAHTQCVVETANASTSHYLVPGLGLTAAATQTGLDVAALEETLASMLSALDSGQAAQLTLQQRVAELEGQLSSLGHSANATTQTELDIEGLEESLLQAADLARGRQHRVAKRGSESLTAAQIVIETQICLISP